MELVVVEAILYVTPVTPEQFIAFVLIKILHNATSVEEIAKNTIITINAIIILKNLLNIPISKLSQLIYYGAGTFSFLILSFYP